MRLLAIVLGAASLASCQAPLMLGTGDDKPAVVVGDKVLVAGNVALANAADAYAIAARSTEAVVRAGGFSDDQLRMIRALNNQASKLLESTDTGLSVAERAASLTLVVTQLRSILGAK